MAAVVFLAAYDLPAQVSQDSEGKKLPPPPIIYVVQLDWFMMPVSTGSSKKRRTIPGTLFLNVRDEDNIVSVCTLEPRIRDAVLQNLFREPPLISKGVLQTEAANARLMGVANGAVGGNKVSRAWLISGVTRRGKDAFKNLPFDNATLCSAIRKAGGKPSEDEK